jgi:tripartite-type tricarboxylate transporter receptor subunit TctC
MRGVCRLLAVVGVALLTVSGTALAQGSRTVRLVVPYPPGGSADILARLLGQQISHDRGVNIVVENRPGAGTVIATDYVSRAATDGNTVLMVANSFVINPHMRKLSYDPLTSFAPVCLLVTSPQVIVVNAASPYRTFADLVAAAKAKPGELTMASVGPATTQHIGIELIKHAANVNLTHIPYTGGAPAINALLGGHVTAVFANYSEVVEQVNAGKLRALVVTSKKRIDPLPAVPTMEELGYKDFEVEVWFGMLAPAKTPKSEVAQLSEWFTAAMQVPEVKAKLVAIGLYPVGMCGDAYAAHIKKQYEEYARVMKEAGIKGE